MIALGGNGADATGLAGGGGGLDSPGGGAGDALREAGGEADAIASFDGELEAPAVITAGALEAGSSVPSGLVDSAGVASAHHVRMRGYHKTSWANETIHFETIQTLHEIKIPTHLDLMFQLLPLQPRLQLSSASLAQQ